MESQAASVIIHAPDATATATTVAGTPPAQHAVSTDRAAKNDDGNPFKPGGPVVSVLPAPGATAPPPPPPPPSPPSQTTPSPPSQTTPSPAQQQTKQQRRTRPSQAQSSPNKRRRRRAIDPLTGFELGVKSARTEAAARVKRKATVKEIRELASKAEYDDDGGNPAHERRERVRAADDAASEDGSAAEDETDTFSPARQQQQHPQPRPQSPSQPQCRSGYASEEKPQSTQRQRQPPTQTSSPGRVSPLLDPVAASVDPERFEIYRVDYKRSEAAGEGITVVEVADVGTKQIRRERRWQPKHFDSACCGRWFVSLEDMEAALSIQPRETSVEKDDAAGDEGRSDARSTDPPPAAVSSPSSAGETTDERREKGKHTRSARNPDQPPTETTYLPRVESYYDCLDACDGGNIHVTLSNLGRADAVRAVAGLLRRVGKYVSVISRVSKKRAGTAKHRVDYRVTAYVKFAKDFAAVHAMAAEIASKC